MQAMLMIFINLFTIINVYYDAIYMFPLFIIFSQTSQLLNQINLNIMQIWDTFFLLIPLCSLLVFIDTR